MKNLRELALEATKNNVVKSSKKESVNESLLRILYDGGEKLTRTELIAQISLDRLVSEYGEDTVTKWVEKDRKKFDEEMAKVNKTVKNGLDTSISHSQNNSSFHYNDKYKHLELRPITIKGEEKWEIVDREAKDSKKSK